MGRAAGRLGWSISANPFMSTAARIDWLQGYVATIKGEVYLRMAKANIDKLKGR